MSGHAGDIPETGLKPIRQRYAEPGREAGEIRKFDFRKLLVNALKVPVSSFSTGEFRGPLLFNEEFAHLPAITDPSEENTSQA